MTILMLMIMMMIMMIAQLGVEYVTMDTKNDYSTIVEIAIVAKGSLVGQYRSTLKQIHSVQR